MKSKKARELICMHENAENADAYYGYEMSVARDAVELAEEDARERAVKAYCAVTSKHTFYKEEYIKTLPEFQEFLKVYDDEN